MTAKQYLSQVRRLDIMIHNKFSELYEAKSMLTSMSILTDSERVQTSGNQDRMGDMVAKVVDLETEAQGCINQYWYIKKKIISQIDAMPKETHYKILYGRYIDGKTFNMIADEMNYSWRQVIRIHGDALQEFERRYGPEFEKMSLNVILDK